MDKAESRASLLEQVRNPLVFFALALLLIEGIFGLVVGTSDMTGDQQFNALLVMAGLFVFVVLVVACLAVWFPKHLYEKIGDEISAAREVSEFVSSPAFRDAILDVVVEREELAKTPLQIQGPRESDSTETDGVG